MPTQLEWQSQVERRVAAIAQFTDAPEPVRHMPLHISGWTERDQLLSDALHAFDVAQGADRTSLGAHIDLFDLAPKDGEPDDAFLAHYKREGGFYSHIAHERAVQTWQQRNDPVLTSDASKTHDPSPAARRWVNGQACYEAILLEHEADVAITVQPLREDLAHIDALIEDAGDAWVEDLMDERDQLRHDILAALEGEKVPPTPYQGRSGKRACPQSFNKRSGEKSVSEALTIPTAERLQRYALTFLAQRYGSQSVRFGTECSPATDEALWANTGWLRSALAFHKQEALDDARDAQARRRGLLYAVREDEVVRVDGQIVYFRPRVSTKGLTTRYVVKGTGKARRCVKVPGSPPVDQRDRAEDRKLLAREYRGWLMPQQRPAHVYVPGMQTWEIALTSRIRAGFRLCSWHRGAYTPTVVRPGTSQSQRLPIGSQRRIEGVPFDVTYKGR